MSSLVTVRITTLEGAEYVFPDVSEDALSKEGGLGSLKADTATYVLVNVSKAVLAVPVRIIKTITAGDRIVWSRPDV